MAYSITQSIMFFITATLIFVVLKYAMSPKKPGDSGDHSWLVLAGYGFITLLAQLIANFSNAKAICQGSSQSFGIVLLYTLIPYFLIFGSIIVLVNIFPGWLSPFSNTIGYLCVSLMGLNTTFTELLDNKKGGPLLTQIYSDKSLIVNEMNKKNYPLFMKEMSKGQNILKSNYQSLEAYNELYMLVILKNIIAEGLWYLLAGCLAISVASNVIINISCNYNTKEMGLIDNKVKALQAKMHEEKDKNKPLLYTKHT